MYVSSGLFFDMLLVTCFCFFKQKTAYEMRISDWSSDVCSSDLLAPRIGRAAPRHGAALHHSRRDGATSAPTVSGAAGQPSARSRRATPTRSLTASTDLSNSALSAGLSGL